MKLFKTVNLEIVRECQNCFGFELPLDKRCREFVSKYKT